MQWSSFASVASIDMQLDSDISGSIVYLMVATVLAKTEYLMVVAPNVFGTLYTMHPHTHIEW